MRITLVTDNRYWRKEFGSHRRISSLCDYLTKQGHEIHVLFQGYLYPPDKSYLADETSVYPIETLGFLQQPIETSSGRPKITDLIDICKRWAKQFIWVIKRLGQPDLRGSAMRHFLLRSQEPKLADFADPMLLARFRTACHEIQPQAIIIEYVRLAYLLDAGRDAIPEGCITLVDTHDVQHERQSRFHSIGEIHDIDITPFEEARALALADAIIAIQPTDAAKFSKLLPGQRVIIAGFPSDIHAHSVRADAGGTVKIGFFGSDMAPNLDAAKALIEQHFPAVRSALSNSVELRLYGKVCNKLKHYADVPGVTLHGFVEDLMVAYSDIDVIANPVSFGGGLKIKNVEALCHGRPLVTTPIGAEGLEDGSGKAFLVAKDKSMFTHMLMNATSTPLLRAELSATALKYAKEHFSDAVVYAELDQLLESTQ